MRQTAVNPIPFSQGSAHQHGYPATTQMTTRLFFFSRSKLVLSHIQLPTLLSPTHTKKPYHPYPTPLQPTSCQLYTPSSSRFISYIYTSSYDYTSHTYIKSQILLYPYPPHKQSPYPVHCLPTFLRSQPGCLPRLRCWQAIGWWALAVSSSRCLQLCASVHSSARILIRNIC